MTFHSSLFHPYAHHPAPHPALHHPALHPVPHPVLHPVLHPVAAPSCPPPEVVQQAQGDADIACHLHCRNARQNVTGRRHTPLRVDAFAQCVAQCRHCRVRQQWFDGSWVDQQCVNDELARTPYDEIQDACPECQAHLRTLLHGARYRCATHAAGR